MIIGVSNLAIIIWSETPKWFQLANASEFPFAVLAALVLLALSSKTNLAAYISKIS